ncbi:unnamed protein product [Rhizoctonia solani]|uniref:Mixed lineage kinase domain-containing protein n=1 Tax=Rhizoctonia solani TaxID=456999 RepID=A0A8H3A886_9AGAM|nr:unnamed protein product [Rhizoctonia solani]
MSGALLGTAFGAMQIIHAAYRDVKSNKEKCASLVQRAEVVVDELKLLANRQYQEEDEGMAERIGALQAAFETTAQIIRQVGDKNWFKALLDADRDAVHVEDCHRRLTDLVLLFNIEQGFDQWAAQRENEQSRKRDHQDLLQVAQSVQSELSTQGEIIGEVLEMVRTLSQSPTFNDPAYGASQTHHHAGSPHLHPTVHQHRLIAKGCASGGGVKGEMSTTPPQIQRRGSWMNRLGFQRISAIRISMPGTGATPSKKVRRMSRPKSVSSLVVIPIAKPKSESSGLPTKIAPNGEVVGKVSPERGRRRILRQSGTSPSTSSMAPLACIRGTKPTSRSPSTSPYSSRYVEIRYYSGTLASGVLLSEAFNPLGKTTLGELRLASSNPAHLGKLSRLNEGNLVMEIPRGIDITDILTISPQKNFQAPLPIIWVLKSCGIHLEPIKISVREAHFGWALVPCNTDMLVQDVAKIIGKLTGRGAIGCFRREGHQTHWMDQVQRLPDCGIGRGMYFEVEIAV